MVEYAVLLSTANKVFSSLPNSDLFNSTSPQAIDSPITRGRTRTVKSSPLARFPPVTLESIAAAAAPFPRLTQKLLSEMTTSTEILPPPIKGTAIGLGHPSASKQRCAPLEPDPASAPKRAHINSSTVQR
ncbi:hypothetical protein MSAN_02100600 [Mycena sanguinolenta]|uniref:Uncharacterized protein n=1 Tax=Mycena sanguinolenta TaxID=230812 RepID=A0A8H7CMH4_9AGAR|nr:hypothetical protein MSAN_02100600 [Mycena sanguinolenta]